ncbi:MAG: sugar transferase [Nanoarchaeota archaeon]|nr:sugar transferase [Nanoarchaeota archaeon]
MVHNIRYKLKIITADIIAVNMAFFLASLLRFSYEIPYKLKYPFFAAFITVVYIATLYFNRLFDKKSMQFMDILFKVFKVVTVATFAIAAIAYFDWTFRLPRTIIVLTWFLAIFFLTIFHYLLRSKSIKKPSALVVGADIVEKLKNIEFNIIGFVDDKISIPIDNKPILGKLKDIRDLIEQYKISNLIFAFPPEENNKILDIILECRDLDVNFKVVPSLYEYVLAGNTTEDQFVDIIVKPANTLYQFWKRTIDIFGSLLIIILLAPIMVLTALLIKIDTEGSVFYKQKRQARFGETFNIIKFRTMVNNIEKISGPKIITHKTKDPRITRIGGILRSNHIDEIPQLFNILKGDMSFVGPRPERPVFSKELNRQIKEWNQRLYIRPGLTGLAQIDGIGSLEAKSKIKKDLYYIKHMSLLLDLKIVFKTIMKILRNK